MSERHIELAKHAIGLDYKKPYTRHGKKFYKPYRNYYGTYTNDPFWIDLADEGYAAHDEPDEKGRVMYWLTEKRARMARKRAWHKDLRRNEVTKWKNQVQCS